MPFTLERQQYLKYWDNKLKYTRPPRCHLCLQIQNPLGWWQDNRLWHDLRSLKPHWEGFPGGAVVKNPPANAGDMGSSPGPGRSHMPQSNKACAPQLLSLRSRTREPQLLSPRVTTTKAHAPRARAPQQEKPLQWEACAPWQRVASACHN